MAMILRATRLDDSSSAIRSVTSSPSCVGSTCIDQVNPKIVLKVGQIFADG
jgi:hypothetical protein